MLNYQRLNLIEIGEDDAKARCFGRWGTVPLGVGQSQKITRPGKRLQKAT
jgi:hypothetical protein